jgi:hypothetical protein
MTEGSGIAQPIQLLGYGLDDGRIWLRFRAGSRDCSSLHSVQPGPEVYSFSYPMGTGGSIPGGKVAGRQADHSFSSSAEAKNTYSYTFTPPYVFMVGCLIKHRDYFTLRMLKCTELEYLSMTRCECYDSRKYINPSIVIKGQQPG